MIYYHTHVLSISSSKMATVYVWSANVIEGSLGHASLYIHDTREYISWWPTDSKRKLALTCKKVGFKD